MKKEIYRDVSGGHSAVGVRWGGGGAHCFRGLTILSETGARALNVRALFLKFIYKIEKLSKYFCQVSIFFYFIY